jgi:hypothetical protein
MLAKGPIGLMVPALAVLGQVWSDKDWRFLFRPAIWLVGLPFLALLLLPMCVGLYQQYGSEGLYFYFWKQSFGRITGQNEWNNDGGLSFFFVHTYVWTFLPWSIISLPEIWLRIQAWWKQSISIPEGYALAGCLLPVVAMSFSTYKLPHYIFVILPLASILTAASIERLLAQPDHLRRKFFAIVQPVQSGVLWLLLLVLCSWAFPMTAIFTWLWLSIGLAYCIYLFISKDVTKTIIWIPIITILTVNLVLYLHLYPALLHFQSTNQAARHYLQHRADLKEKLYSYLVSAHSLDFYTGYRIFEQPDLSTLRWHYVSRPIWVYTTGKGLDSLQLYKQDILEVIPFDQYHISKLTIPFVNPATREATVEKRYLVHFSRRDM